MKYKPEDFMYEICDTSKISVIRAAECANARLPEIIKPLEEKLRIAEEALQYIVDHDHLTLARDWGKEFVDVAVEALAIIREGEK